MDAVSEVKARLNIEDVVAEYVSLKRAGKNYKGLSPFTSEKTPSFVVSPDKQIWHDFSSGRGGDMFSFVQEVEGLDFKATLELLARKAGVDLEKYQKSSGNRVNKELLHEILEKATKFYQANLLANQSALDYVVKKRGFNKQTLVDFRLGYSPNNGDVLVKFLTKLGYNSREITLSGLTSQRRGGTGDMFRGRLMIPLSDQFGKTIGFTARILEEKSDAPKYINTPSTPLYDKSRHIYGLHLAKTSIQKHKFSVLAEGNLDVISSHQAGVKNVVATAGTALTLMQLKTLGRFSPDVRLAFDEDRAGLAATERAIPLASQANVRLSVITIPSGKDPDELIRQDAAVWQSVIEKSDYAIDWLLNQHLSQIDPSSIEGKKHLAGVLLPVLNGLTSQIEKDHYISKLADILKVDKNSVISELGGIQAGQPIKRLKQIKQPNNTDPNLQERIKVGDRLLTILLMLPKTRIILPKINQAMFVNDQAEQLFNFLQSNPEFRGDLKDTKDLKVLSEYVKIITLQFEELYAKVDPVDLQDEITRLYSRLVELYVKDQKQQIISKMNNAKESEMNQYLAEVKDLDQLLSNLR